MTSLVQDLHCKSQTNDGNGPILFVRKESDYEYVYEAVLCSIAKSVIIPL